MNLATETAESVRSSPLTILAIGVLGTTSVYIAGIPGVLVGLVAIATWRVLPPVYVVAIGQLGVATLLGPEPPLRTFAAFQGALLTVLVGDLLDHRRTPGSLGTGLLFILGTGTVAVAATSWLDERWLAVLLVVGFLVLVGYGVHRYTVVHFDLNNEY